MRTVRLTSILVAAVAALAVTLSAQSLPKLPRDVALPQSAGSPGAVTFSHELHLAVQERPDCLACHPRLFRTLEPHATADRQPISHAQMEQKKQCGACHNGQDASGLDDCARCHRM